MTFTVITKNTSYESAEIEADTWQEAIDKACYNPDDYDWKDVGEITTEYELG